MWESAVSARLRSSVLTRCHSRVTKCSIFSLRPGSIGLGFVWPNACPAVKKKRPHLPTNRIRFLKDVNVDCLTTGQCRISGCLIKWIMKNCDCRDRACTASIRPRNSSIPSESANVRTSVLLPVVDIFLHDNILFILMSPQILFLFFRRVLSRVLPSYSSHWQTVNTAAVRVTSPSARIDVATRDRQCTWSCRLTKHESQVVPSLQDRHFLQTFDE